jgi:LAO/AO transport system kinase
MNEFPSDGSVYFRSMATRGASGGLAGATDNVAVLLDAFGYDITLIETVGVGQVEFDIINACDVVVVVIVPESGDAVQMLKAGLMEIADVFCINKADRPGAQRLAADLKYTLDLRQNNKAFASRLRAHALVSLPADASGHRPPIIQTEATTGKNIDTLHNEIASFINRGHENQTFESRRRRRLCVKITAVLNSRFQSDFVSHVAQEGEIEKALGEIIAGRTNPYQVADSLYRRFREK